MSFPYRLTLKEQHKALGLLYMVCIKAEDSLDAEEFEYCIDAILFPLTEEEKSSLQKGCQAGETYPEIEQWSVSKLDEFFSSLPSDDDCLDHMGFSQ